MAYHCISGNRECDGCMMCEKEEVYTCPVCGGELGGGDNVVFNKNGDIVGCENCINHKEAWEALGDD